MATDYMARLFTPQTLKEDVKLMASYIKASGVEYDLIAARGVSGLVFASALSLEVGRGVAAVRKPNDGTHAGTTVEFNRLTNPTDKYIIVDDFVASGDTCNAIIKTMNSWSYRCSGVFCYCNYDNDKTMLHREFTLEHCIPVVYTNPNKADWITKANGMLSNLSDREQATVTRMVKALQRQLKQKKG